MKRIALLSAVLLALAIGATSCKKKEPPPPTPPMPGQGMPGMPGQPGAGMPSAPAPEKKVVVPDAVKAGWKAVKLEVELKDKKTKKQYTIPLNSEFKVPDTDMVIKTGDFFPHFAMTADTITSNSNNLENPAARIEVFLGGKEAFHGWIFAKFPTVHPFQNDKYGVILLEGIKK